MSSPCVSRFHWRPSPSCCLFPSGSWNCAGCAGREACLRPPGSRTALGPARAVGASGARRRGSVDHAGRRQKVGEPLTSGVVDRGDLREELLEATRWSYLREEPQLAVARVTREMPRAGLYHERVPALSRCCSPLTVSPRVPE